MSNPQNISKWHFLFPGMQKSPRIHLPSNSLYVPDDHGRYSDRQLLTIAREHGCCQIVIFPMEPGNIERRIEVTDES